MADTFFFRSLAYLLSFRVTGFLPGLHFLQLSLEVALVLVNLVLETPLLQGAEPRIVLLSRDCGVKVGLSVHS